MPILATCPSCQAALNAPDSAAGKQVRCPRCKTAVPIPKQDDEAEMQLLLDAAEDEVGQPTGTTSLPPPPRPTSATSRTGGTQPSATHQPKRSKINPRTPRPGGTTRFLALVFLIVGALCLLWGMGMDTTVSTGGQSVHNIGLISDKQLRVFGGLGSIAIGVLLRIMVAVEATHRDMNDP